MLLVHGCLCQQPTSYAPQSQTKLEDIERDTLKSAQSVTASPQVQSQVPTQYVQYSPQEQSYYGLIAPQTAVPVAPGQQAATPGVGQQVFTVPNQQSAALFAAQQQQPIFYFNPQQQPQQPQQQQQAYDFSGLSLYPFVLPQGGVPNVLSADYYKSLQASAGQAKAPGVPTANIASPAGLPATAAGATATIPSQAFKNVPGFQFGSNYFIPAAPQTPLYQPVSFQPPNAATQYYYNSLYQLQSPQKSVYAAGVKSTTPASPLKTKDDQFVPIGSSNYRLEYSTADQLSNYGKKYV